MKSRGSALVLVVLLTVFAALPSAAAPAHSAMLRDLNAGPCVAGGGYNPACDVNHDGAVNVVDIQLAAGHFNQTGTFTSDNDHNHLGQTWTGNSGLRFSGSFGDPDYAPLRLYNSNPDGAGLIISGAGDTGIVINSAGNNGMFIGNTGFHGIYVFNTASDGILVGGAGGAGVSVSVTGTDGVAVGCAGSVTSCTPDTAYHNGFEVGHAQDYGVKVVLADRAAFRSDNSGTNGLYVATAGDSGVWIADATNWAGFFTGDINVTGNCTGCLIARFAVNSGEEVLQPGDIVAVDGVRDSPFDGVDMLLQVRRAAAGSPLLGVVSGRAEPFTSSEDGSSTLVPRNGQPAAPGDYLSVVIYGPVQVKATGDVAVGQRVTAGDGGVRAMRRVEVEGVTLDEGGSSLGMALEAPKDGMVWVLVNPQ